MLLKSLEMQGFKSFPDKTKLDFHQGVTAVVGPNGSGKSNISDAVRWVLGETSSKSLRGSKMEDVIFGGTQDRKPQGFAQVSLAFDNTTHLLDWEGDEVVVTRKYYRSGESEYFINGKPVLLKNIVELFMDTGLGRDGYSIIGQGRIDEIVSARSGDRREIFEEAAGITKYRYRKQESERKLQKAEENLVRLRDILGELESRIGPLKEQSEKAKQFLELADQKKTLEISLWVHTLESSKQNLRQQEDELLLARQNYDTVVRELNTIEEQTQKVYEQIQQLQMQTEQLRLQKEQNEQTSSQRIAKIAVLHNDIEHNQETIQRFQEEIRAFSATSEQLEQQKLQKAEEIQTLQTAMEELQIKLEQLEQQLLQLSQQGSDFSDYYEQLNQRLNHLVLERSKNKLGIVTKQDQLQQQYHQQELLQQNYSRGQSEANANQEELMEVKQLLEQLEENRGSLFNSKQGYQLKLESRKKKQQELNDYLDRLNTEISSYQQRIKILSDLENSLEGFAYSVKTIMKESQHGQLPGIHGTIAQLIELPSKYAIAIETALGGSLQHVVVENENAAKRAIRFLKEKKAGRATFLPLTSIRGNKLQQNLQNEEGYLGLASDLVHYDPAYEQIILNALGRTVVVEDLDDATVIAKKYQYKFRIVTLDGQLVNAGGSFTGGSQNKNAGLLNRKNEISELQQGVKRLVEKQESYQGTKQQLDSQVSQLEAQLQGIDSEMTVLNEDMIRYTGEQKRLSQLEEQQQQRLRDIQSQTDRCALEIERFQQEIKQAEQVVEQSETEMKAVEQELSGLKESRDDLVGQRKELDNQMNQLRIQRAERGKELENAQMFLQELENRSRSAQDRLGDLEQNIQTHQQQIKQLEQQIVLLEEESNNFTEQQAILTAKIEQSILDKNQLEQQTTELRRKEQEQTSSREKIGQNLARLEERKTSMQKEYDSIISRMWEEYQVAPTEAQEIAVSFDDPFQFQKELNLVKSKIKGLGSVNVGAIEEYQEVSERYEFMNSQVQDVEHSKQELERLIRDLTSDMTMMFRATFDQINHHFREIFVELFGGGTASLNLDDEENILECGIEIQVQPPGKIIKNLSALSGGEKALVAIAIYFAILKVNPSPFCILDEIEAALDDVNVAKFASYLKTIDDKTQFIVITHRRGTMEQADVLYGVTMQEQGVSKLLELKVTEIEQKMQLQNA